MSAGLRLEGRMVARSVRRMFDARHEPRDSSDASALLAWRGSAITVGLANISPSGAMVTCGENAQLGEAVTLQLADRAAMPGVIRWVRDGRIGIHFIAPLK